MSHIFDTLRRVESERNGMDPHVPSDTVELLGLVGRRFSLDLDPEARASREPNHRPLIPHEQRLRVVGSPLSVGGRTPASVPAPSMEPADPPTPAALPDPPATIQASASAPSLEEAAAQETRPFMAPVFEIHREEEPLAVQPEVELLQVLSTHEAPFQVASLQAEPAQEEVPAPFDPPQVVFHQPTPIQTVPVPVIEAPVVEIAAIPAPVVPAPEVPIQVVQPPVQAAPPPAQPAPAPVEKELVPASQLDLPQIKLPPAIQRAVSAVRTALPIVSRLLPLFEGNFSAALSNILAPLNPEPVAPPPAVEIDLAPVQSGLAELKTMQLELSEQVIEQGASFKRIDDHLEMVRLSTDRNTLEQQELIEELKGVGKKVNVVVIIALTLLATSVALNTALYLHITKILR